MCFSNVKSVPLRSGSKKVAIILKAIRDKRHHNVSMSAVAHVLLTPIFRKGDIEYREYIEKRKHIEKNIEKRIKIYRKVRKMIRNINTLCRQQLKLESFHPEKGFQW